MNDGRTYIDILLSVGKYEGLTEDNFICQELYCPKDFFYGEKTPDEYGGFCLAEFSEITVNGGTFKVRSCRGCIKCWRGISSPSALREKNYIEAEDILSEYNSRRLPENSPEAVFGGKAENISALVRDTEEKNALFDYSGLDGETASKLSEAAKKIINAKKRYIFTVAKEISYAHELLARRGDGRFGAWCESVGITRQTGNNLLKVVKIFESSTDEEIKILSSLRPSLLYEVSKPSAPPELVRQVRNGDITNHREYMALKKQLEETARRLEEVTEKKQTAEKQRDALEAENKELSRRPKDTYYDVNEVDRQVKDAVSKISADFESSRRNSEMEYAENLHIKDRRIWELEDMLKNSENNEMIVNFYDSLHAGALTAVKSCYDLITDKNISRETAKILKVRFRELKNTVDGYIGKMEDKAQ